jgi:hypothetical protein
VAKILEEVVKHYFDAILKFQLQPGFRMVEKE